MPGRAWQEDRKVIEGIIPNPKLKLLDQVREVLRIKHYSIRTESCYCDWIRRYIRFHKMQSREELNGGEAKIELFLSDLAVKRHVAASTQNQAFNALLFLTGKSFTETSKAFRQCGPIGRLGCPWC